MEDSQGFVVMSDKEQRQIVFRQTGGFAGLAKSATVDLDQVSPEEETQLKDLIEQAALFDIPDPPQSARPDEEQYMLEVNYEGRSRMLYMPASSVPPNLKPLVKHLSGVAKYEKRQRKK